MGGQAHQSDPRVLGRRTLENDHRCLSALLAPGMRVLDVGCGTGAITAGIARAVGPNGFVVGIDRDESLLAIAREQHRAAGNMVFESRDVLDLDVTGKFDIVTAARTLQWVADPRAAILRMRHALKPHGRLVLLDYVHLDNTWDPAPPESFRRFYSAFLAWRDANGWDNQIGKHLAELASAAGLHDVTSCAADETASRGDAAFDAAVRIWLHVIQTIGPAIVAAGFAAEPDRLKAEREYHAFVIGQISRQCLSMRCIVAALHPPTMTRGSG